MYTKKVLKRVLIMVKAVSLTPALAGLRTSPPKAPGHPGGQHRSQSLLRGGPAPVKQKCHVYFLSTGMAADIEEHRNTLLAPFPINGLPYMLHRLQSIMLLWRKATTFTLQCTGIRWLCWKQKGGIIFLPVDDQLETWSSLCSTESNKLHYPWIIQRPFEPCSWIICI